MTTERSAHLIFNVVPVSFSEDSVWIGTTLYIHERG